MRVAIGEPDMETRLALRLLKNFQKHFHHFGTFPTIFLGPLPKHFSLFDIDPTQERYKYQEENSWAIKQDMFTRNLRKTISDKKNGIKKN